MLASAVLQQSPAQPYYSQTGNWEFITLSDGSRARWRNAPVLPSDPVHGSRPDAQPPQTGDPSRIEAIDTHGIHAVVLPRKVYFPDPGNADPQAPPIGLRGAVMLWGNGTQFTTSGSPFSDDYAFSPYLLWHHQLAIAGDRWRMGFIGYTHDRLWGSALPLNEPELHYNNCANLFCSAASLMPDGRLFVAGGSQYARFPSETQIHGTFGCYAFDPEQWRFNATTTAQSGWSEPLGPNGALGVGMNRWRWYPSTLALPNRKMLIVGGTKYAMAGVGAQCASDDDAFEPPAFSTGHRYNATFQIYDSATNQFTEHPLRKQACNGTEFANEDQRRTLGNEYPRLHNVAWMSGSQIVHRAAAVGPTYSVYLMDPENLAQGAPGDQPPFNWTRYGVCAGEAPTTDYTMTRSIPRTCSPWPMRPDCTPKATGET